MKQHKVYRTGPVEKTFLVRLFSGIGDMLVKLLSSRKALFQIFSKIITVYLLMTIKDAMWQVILFVVSTVADFVYFNELNFEKVKTEVTLKTP